jgi:hypothetical protein
MVIGPYGPHFMEDQHIVGLIDPEISEPVPEGQHGLSAATNPFSEAARMCAPPVDVRGAPTTY